MKYLLKTEVNENGNKVFSKMRQGKGYIYLAKDENGNIGQVDKHWILNHKDYIVNLGVSGDSIYPVDVENKQKKDIVEEAADIIREYYSEMQSGSGYAQLNGNKLDCIEAHDGGWINVNHYFDINAFDLAEIDNCFYNIAFKQDDSYESLIEMCQNVHSANDIYNLSYAIKDADEYDERLKEVYKKCEKVYSRWETLCKDYSSEELAEMVAEKYEAEDLVH